MDNTSASLPVAIIGGGVTGLAAAYRLAQLGRRVRLFESSPRLGGAVQSERDGAWLIESGPNSVQENSAQIGALFTELGLDAHRLYARPEAKNRYIVRGGRPVAAPTSPPGLITSPLFSARAKLRLFGDLFMRPKTRTTDLSLADFVASHFGRELVDYGLNPFVSGVYAGDPTRLSARHAFPSLWAMEQSHGSIIRGQIAAAKAKRARGESKGPARILSFTEGLGLLPQALAARLPAGAVELGARVDTLLPGVAGAITGTTGAPWTITWSRDGATFTEAFSDVVLAAPAAALAKLKFTVGPRIERPLAELEEIEYPPVSSLFLGYRRDQVAHPLDGFGMLVPALERRSVLGVLFNSTLFAGRAPEGHIALTVMTGGVVRPDLAQLDQESLLAIVKRELADLLGVRGDPVFVRRNVWPRAIPQYNLGYERFLDAIAAAERAFPGLHVAGHVRDGIALTACLASGLNVATRLAAK